MSCEADALATRTSTQTATNFSARTAAKQGETG
jgi:hypothetical protein